MAWKITLPRLVGTREAADELVESTPKADGDECVWLLSRALSTSTISFADELVSKLKDEGARKILIVAGPERFKSQMIEAATRHQPVEVRPATDSDLAMA